MLESIFSLSREQVLSLTEEQIKYYITVELVNNNLPIDILSKSAKRIKTDLEPVGEVFRVGGVYTTDLESAKIIKDFMIKGKIVDLSGVYLQTNQWSSYVRYIEDRVYNDIAIELVNIHDKTEAMSIKDKNEAIEKSGYDMKSIQKANEIKMDVLNHIAKLRIKKEEEDRLVNLFNEYVEITKGDKEVAWNLFKKANKNLTDSFIDRIREAYPELSDSLSVLTSNEENEE